jgi:uncharacterized protein (DUF2235 family)
MSNQALPPHVDPSRHLVLLIDGTWVSASQKHAGEQQSNIYWLNLFLEPHNDLGEAQITFYQSGIGSATQGGKWRGGVLGQGLELLVEQAYVNIVSNFCVTDKIYIFGFSRGAVIARIVAYLISKFGVLKQESIQFFGKMWKHIRGETVDEEAIKLVCYQDVPVEFLGLFDTVRGPLATAQAGLVDNVFRHRKLPKTVRTAVHMLAMHESRNQFSPILFEDVERTDQHFEQIWMPGVHSDIGGGYTSHFLGNVSLITMLDRLKQKTTLTLIPERLSKLRTSIQNDFEEGNLVINNELVGWWRKFGTEERIPSEDNKYQFYHQILSSLEHRFIQMKAEQDHKEFTMEEFTARGWLQLRYARVELLDGILRSP